MFNNNRGSKKAKVYVTPNGGQSVKVNELLKNPEVMEDIRAMQDIIDGNDITTHSEGPKE